VRHVANTERQGAADGSGGAQDGGGGDEPAVEGLRRGLAGESSERRVEQAPCEKRGRLGSRGRGRGGREGRREEARKREKIGSQGGRGGRVGRSGFRGSPDRPRVSGSECRKERT
jgi:hypothetical protein